VTRRRAGRPATQTRSAARKATIANAGRTMYDKIIEDHKVRTQDDGTLLLYIDRHMIHEVTSPQAFEGLRTAGRSV